MTNPVKLVIIFLSIFILIGCSRISREDYDKIELGMNYQQVVEILGKADKCDAAFGIKNCVWGDEEKNITIKFIAEKVVAPTMKGL